MDSLTILKSATPVMPVIALNDLSEALPLANALLEGGINVFEITLRTSCALEAITLIKQSLPECLVGAGTVLSTEQFDQVADAEGDFIISPGITSELLTHAIHRTIPFIPGVSSASEVMLAVSNGLKHLKFFPAEQAGGSAMLKALAGPFSEVIFCPTGGISPKNVGEYLALNNVACVGGSWLAPRHLIEEKNWKAITQLAHASKELGADNLSEDLRS